MALFNFKRKKQDPSVLPEIDQYYQGERRDRAGVAWLLAILSVIIVAVFIIVLFFAGRWAYNKISGNDKGNQISINDKSDDDNESIPSFDGEKNSSPENSEEKRQDNSTQTNENKESNKGDEEINPEGTVDAPTQTTTPSDPNAPKTPIPSTGPEHTLAVFVAVSLLAGGMHYLISHKKISKLE